MDKVTPKQIKEYTIRADRKQYIVRYCVDCKLPNRRFVLCDDGTVNIVTSCGCTPVHREYKSSWQEVADWLNGKEIS